MLIILSYFEPSYEQQFLILFFEAARIDGAGHFRVFVSIVLPLLKAGIATVGLFNIVSRWNDWFTGMLYIQTPKLIPSSDPAYQAAKHY